VRRVYVVSVAAAMIVGVAAGVVLHNVLSGGSADARPPALPLLHGQATWGPGRVAAPGFALRDQHGRRVSLSSFRGHQVVLAFMDSYCTAECPLESRQLAAAIRPLPVNVRPQLLIVSVNLADTTHSIAAAARKWGLPAGFEWLVGTHAQLARVWHAYGIVVRPTSSGDIAHSDAFYVIDRSGDERAGFLSPFVPGLLTADLRVLSRA
jgi:cytochrome oxidase Cu insertion factor (SCO1/SenC/PrrC family)